MCRSFLFFFRCFPGPGVRLCTLFTVFPIPRRVCVLFSLFFQSRGAFAYPFHCSSNPEARLHTLFTISLIPTVVCAHFLTRMNCSSYLISFTGYFVGSDFFVLPTKIKQLINPYAPFPWPIPTKCFHPTNPYEKDESRFIRNLENSVFSWIRLNSFPMKLSLQCVS